MTNHHDDDVPHWWRTSIIETSDGKIAFRGKPIEQLMGNMSFSQMIWFLVMGSELPKEKSELFELALMMGVDHGPQAPSIAISRMAITCGVGLNNAIGSAVNVLGDVHGGAGEQCAELFNDIHGRLQSGTDLKTAIADGVTAYQEANGKIIPGFGHRWHKTNDPRTVRMYEILEDYVNKGVIKGDFINIAKGVQEYLTEQKGRPIPMNVDGATCTIYCELGAPGPLSRGFFCLSRSVGILAHAWEQMGEPERNKGPIPRKYLPLYVPQDENK